MLQTCSLCGANILHAELHDNFHLLVADLEERLAIAENQLDEVRSQLLTQSRG